MTLIIEPGPDSQPCGSCCGNGCRSCKGTGEECADYLVWRCTSCLVEGEGDPGDECPSCGDSNVDRITRNTEPDSLDDDDSWRE